MDNNKPNSWIVGLDSLRFVLALIVMLGHFNVSQYLEVNESSAVLLKLAKAFIGNSFVGVAAVISFFVLSGIVIHYPYRNGKVLNVKEFLLQRYLRIGLPMLVILILAKSTHLDLNAFPFWSLYCELIYYTLYPLLSKAFRRTGINPFLVVSFVLSYLLVFLFSSNASDFITQKANYNGNYWQFGIQLTWLLGLPTWLLGVKIAQIMDKPARSASVLKMNLIRVSVFFIAFTCSFSRFHMSLSYTLSLNIFSLLAAFWIYNEILFWKPRKPNGFLEKAGKWSYSLYICHPFAWFLVPMLVHKMTFPSFILQVVVALSLAYIFYRIIEKPSHVFAKKMKVAKMLKYSDVK